MLSNFIFWLYLTVIILYFFILFKPISSQGIACYKCMTINSNNDSCRDPFSSLLNPIHTQCQVDVLVFLCMKLKTLIRDNAVDSR